MKFVGVKKYFGVGIFVALSAATLLLAPAAKAESVTLEPTRDTYVNSDAPNGSYGNIGLGTVASGPGDGSSQKVLMYFDLSSIPAGSTVESAKLTMRLGGCINSSAYAGRVSIGAYLANGSPAWTESSTYQQLSTSGSSLEILYSQDVLCTPGSYVDFGATSLVGYWLDGTMPNDGLLLNQITGGGYWTRVFYMSEATASSRPKLVINYTVPSEVVTSPDGGPSEPTATVPASNTASTTSSPQPFAEDSTISSPETLLLTQISNKSHIKVVWKKSSTTGVSKYHLYRKVGSKGVFEKLAEINADTNEYIDGSTKYDKGYSYFVRAVRDNKESKNSPEASLYTKDTTKKTAPKSAVVLEKKSYNTLLAILIGLGLAMLIGTILYMRLHRQHHKLKSSTAAKPKKK